MIVLLALLGGFVGLGMLLFFNDLLSGYALSVLWEWFIVPTFGAPHLGVVPAIGIAMVVSYMTYQNDDCKKEKRTTREEVIRLVAMAVMKPGMSLFFGWIVHLFM